MSEVEGLVGDIGGTNARFALATIRDGRPAIREPRSYANRDYASAEAAIEAYLAEVGVARTPDAVVLAVAGPVTDGAADFTNSDWVLSEPRLRSTAGFRLARLINDFAAQALGAPRVAADGLRRIGPEVEGDPDAPVAVLGPGTGFGLAGLVRVAGREAVVPTEGGHACFAPCDDLEVEIRHWFIRRHGRVSIERVLCGRGLYELYLALGEIQGVPAPQADEKQVQATAADGSDPLAAAAVDRFCLILGATAGDIALTMGARGGVYVTGGVAQRLADRIVAGGFRDRFEDKGRFRDYMRAIPSVLIVEHYTALIGAAVDLGRLEGLAA